MDFKIANIEDIKIYDLNTKKLIGTLDNLSNTIIKSAVSTEELRGAFQKLLCSLSSISASAPAANAETTETQNENNSSKFLDQMFENDPSFYFLDSTENEFLLSV